MAGAVTTLTPTNGNGLGRRFRHIPYTTRFVFSIPSVLAGQTSDRYKIDTRAVEGVIQQVRVAYPNSTTTDLFFFTRCDALRGRIMEVLRIVGITQCFSQGALNIMWENDDDPLPQPNPCATDVPRETALYLEIDNTGGVVPTGTIELELIVVTEGS